MVQKDALHRMIKFNQTLFENAFEATAQRQDQVEKIGNTMMDPSGGLLPGEGRKVYDNCVTAFKAGRSNFKTYIDEGYQKAEKFFG